MENKYLHPTPEHALNQLGFTELREEQKAPLQAILDGNDVINIMPTDGGKSAVFQIPALCFAPALTLVLSPLKALQADQVAKLQTKHIEARLLNSSLSDAERQQVFQDIRDRKVTLLYLAPEQLQNPETRAELLAAEIGMVVLDEAHTMVNSFRKAYGQIGKFIKELNHRPVIAAFTATASKSDRKKIRKKLNMQNPEIITNPIRRSNLHLHIKCVKSKKDTAKQRLVKSTLKE